MTRVTKSGRPWLGLGVGGLVAVGIVVVMYGQLVRSIRQFPFRPDLVAKLEAMTLRSGATAAVVAACLVVGTWAWSAWRRASRHVVLLALADVALFLCFLFAPWFVGAINTSGHSLDDLFMAWVDPGTLITALPSLAGLAGAAVSWVLSRIRLASAEPAA